MNHRLMPLVCIALIFCPIGADARKGATTVAAAVVESTELAEVVRLVVSPPLENFSYKIICGESSIRVRLNGVSSRRKKADNLPVPKQGPMKKVRIASRGHAGSVIQIFPRQGALAACSRTTLVTLGGEIVVSLALSDTDKARQKRILKSQNKTTAKNLSTALRDEGTDRTGQSHPEGKEKKESKNLKAGKPKSTPLFASMAHKNQAGQSKEESSKQLGIPASDIESNLIRFLVGLGLAAIAVSAFLYIRQRKRGLIASGDTIEILSSRTLGARQQLVLASVQDTKFLLAVGEKSVSTLGIVPDGAKAVLPDKELPSNDLMNLSDETNLSLGNPVREEQLQPIETSNDNRHGASKYFQNEFKGAIEAALNIDDLSARTEERLSNVTGLIAMARMRTDSKHKTKPTPTVEA